MIAPLILASSSIGISLIFNANNWRRAGLFFSFLPVLLFLAFRFDYGNDYLSYLYMFKEIASSGTQSYDSGEWHAEVGWFYLNRFFSGVGFFSMIVALAAFNCYVYFRFIKKFVPYRYYWFALFLYVIVPENMLVQSSAMRQAVSISIFLLGIEYIIQRNLVKYVLCIGAATLFHSSALILLLVYFLGASRITISEKLTPIFIGCYIVLFFLQDFLKETVFAIANVFTDNYAIYQDAGSAGSGFGLIFYGLYLAIMLMLHDRQTATNKVIFRIAIVGIYLIPFAVSVSMFSRVAFYFSVVGIAVVPLIAAQIKTRQIRIGFIVLQVFYGLYGYFKFIDGPIYRVKFFEYKTIFSSASFF